MSQTVLDLFSGPGGLGTGFSKYFDVETAIDWNEDACKTYKSNHSKTQVLPKDITKLDFSKQDYQGIIGVIGGPPCQPYSRLNGRKKEEDERKDLLFEMSRVANQIKPDFVLIENVTRVPKSDKLRLVKELQQFGYKVVSQIVKAHDYGSVQIRKRWMVVANREKHIFPEPSYRNRIAKEILTNEKSSTKIKPENLKLFKYLKKGKWDSLRGKSDYAGYYVVDPDEPLAAIVNPTKLRYIKPDRSGYLSWNELYRAQGFPEGYQFHGLEKSKGQQLANAVPVELAQSFAAALKANKNLGDWF